MPENVERSREQFGKALMRLEEVLLRTPEQDQIVIDATIQRFEFTVELCWKALKNRLYKEGIQTTTPRSVMQEAYTAGWLVDESIWLNMLRDRNLTSHTYREEQALEIYKNIPVYASALRQLYEKL